MPRNHPTMGMSNDKLNAYAQQRGSLRPGTRLENTDDKEHVIEVSPCEHCKGSGERSFARRRDGL